MLALSAVLLPATALGAPSGSDLLNACSTALQTNFRGMEGRMCIWYVTPCDCAAGGAAGGTAALPRVCVPDETSTHTLAFEVSELLKAIPEYQRRDAGEAAALILSEIYPCAE